MKRVYNCDYVHVSALRQLCDERSREWVQLFYQRIFPHFLRIHPVLMGEKLSERELLSEYANIVIKSDKGKNTISFIRVDNWVGAYEPEILGILTYSLDTMKAPVYRQGTGQIYHSKELFVAEGYKAFNVRAAKARTQMWNDLLFDVPKSKIGYKHYWEQVCMAYGVPLNSNGVQGTGLNIGVGLCRI